MTEPLTKDEIAELVQWCAEHPDAGGELRRALATIAERDAEIKAERERCDCLADEIEALRRDLRNAEHRIAVQSDGLALHREQQLPHILAQSEAERQRDEAVAHLRWAMEYGEWERALDGNPLMKVAFDKARAFLAKLKE